MSSSVKGTHHKPLEGQPGAERPGDVESFFEAFAVVTDPAIAEQAREALYRGVTDYLHALVIQAGGEITAAVLAETDRLYDRPPGLTRVIADALGLEPGELRQLLGKRELVVCSQCGGSFPITRPRVKGGYRDIPYRPLCEQCEAEEREERAEKHHLEREAEIRKVIVDAKLEASSSPLSIPAFRQHLEHYLEYWCSRGHRRSGCMVCGGSEHLSISVTADVPREDTRFWDLAQWLAEDQLQPQRENDISLPPIQNHWQVLWRLKPEVFFEHCLLFPVSNMAIVVLCELHASLVAGTHIRVAERRPG